MMPGAERVRYHNPLDGLLFSTTATRVLRALVRAGGRPLSGRELGRRAHAPPHRTTEALVRFEAEGLAQSKVVGRAYLWSIDPRHPLAPPLRRLFATESRAAASLNSRLRGRLARIPGVRRAVIFGSAARGGERPGSDLDLLVVADNRKALRRIEERLWALQRELYRDGRVRLSPILYTKREFDSKQDLPLMRAVALEGEVLVSD